jgi:hypothetical protein
MDKPVMFNGRLNKDEVDIWLKLLNETSESGFNDRDLAKAFLMLPGSITFVSSIEDKFIGGTSIYRDRTRLAMVLVSVAVNKKFRESATYQIIKSSMPFFKTVAIRDADVLVSKDDSLNRLGFPLSLELDPWTRDIIKRIGFEEVGTIEHYSFTIVDDVRESTIRWTSKIDTESVRELIWNQSKPLGLTNSLIWLARDFAEGEGCLMSISTEGEVSGVAGFWQLSGTLCVSPIVTDSQKLKWNHTAESLIAEALRIGVKRIELPLIGKGQGDLIQALDRMCDRTSCRKLSLMRKPL